MKKLFLAYILVLTLVLTGCMGQLPGIKKPTDSSGSSSEKPAAEKRVVSLAVSTTDSFCPYNAVTLINRDVSTLLYDSLVRLDNKFTAHEQLAKKIEISEKTVTVTLKSVSFADGSPLTADDVVYCAERAKKSDTRYADSLRDVTSVSAASSNTVVFTLKKVDPFFKNQLDFPIYKQNSDDQTSSDNLEIPPIGCGQYVLNDDKTELLANKSYHGGAPKLKKIKLINTPDSDALRHNLEVGNITCYYSDLSGCELPQVRGGYKKVNLNNLVYLGANMKSGLMTYTDMRKVVSTAIGRDDIVENAYFGNATPTSDIYNPGWQERESVAWAGENVANENVYLALLTKIGYNKKDNSGFYVNEDGERLSLSLVYNKGNIWRESAAKLIKTHLRAAGIKVELKALEWEEYKTYLKEGWFDLYLAEVKIGNNMDVSELVTRGGSAAWGVDYKKKKDEDKEKPSEPDGTADNALGDTSTDGTAMGDDGTAAIEPEEPPHDEFAGDTAEALKKLYSGEETTDLTAVSTAFASEMPIIPICYRSGILSYSTDINGISPSYGEVYRGIGNTTI